MKRFRVLIWIVALLAPIALAGSKLSPKSVEGATTIDVTKAKALWDEGALFVDVRKDKDWEAGRIPSALHLDLKTAFSEKALLEEVGKDEALVMYCNGIKCLRSSKACAKAVAWGFTRVYYFRGGLPDWRASGYPVE